VRAGPLRRRLRLRQPVRTRTASGAFTTTWTTVATVYGSIEALKGRDYFDAGQMNVDIEARCVIRYGSDWANIDDSWQIEDVASGKTFDIVSVLDAEFRTPPKRMFEIMVKKGKAAAG